MTRIPAPSSLARRSRRLGASAMVAALAAVVLTACGLDSGSSSSSDQSIVVYNAQHESLTQKWADAFTAETGVKVELRNGSDFDLGNQLVAEGDASKADVYLTENSPAISMVASKGLLADPGEVVARQVPQAYRPSTGNWAGIAARSTVFVYNTDTVKAEELPKSLDDLASPRWKGKWAASPSGADFQAIVSASVQLAGEPKTRTWLESMRKEDGGFNTYKGNKAVMAAVNNRQIDGGVIYHYYLIGDRAKTGESSAHVGQHYFRDGGPGSFVSLSGGGVLNKAPHSANARKFLEFVTGVKGQEILRDNSFEYPVASGVAANSQLVPLAELNAPTVDPASLNGAPVTALLTSIGLQ